MEAERDWKMSGFGDQQKAEVSFTSTSARSSAVPPNIPVSPVRNNSCGPSHPEGFCDPGIWG